MLVPTLRLLTLFLLRFDDTTTAIVEVGPTKKPFVVHQDILCEASDFFKLALNSKMREGTDQLVRLPEDSPDVFNDFFNCVYGQQYRDLSVETMHSSTEIAEATLVRFIDLYRLADKMQAQNMKRQMIDAFYQLFQTRHARFIPKQKLLRECYEKTSAGSAIRAMFIATWAYVGSSDIPTEIENAIKEDLTDIPEIATDLACQLLQQKAGKNSPFVGIYETSEQFYEPSMREGEVPIVQR